MQPNDTQEAVAGDTKRKAWTALQSHDHHHPQADIAKATF
jgi:hypothetical protein